METIKEVYDNLKKYDTKNQLTLSDNEEVIELKINDKEKLVAEDDRLGFIIGRTERMHWHPDFDATYLYLLEAMKGIMSIKKAVADNAIYNVIFNIIVLAIIILVVIGARFADLIGIENSFFRIIIGIAFCVLFICGIRFIYKKLRGIYRELRKNKDGHSLDCEDPSMAENEVERNYNCDEIRNVHSIDNKSELLNDNSCGCFYCLEIFNPDKIEVWMYDSGIEDENATAICPFCGMNTVIGESSGYSITKEFLEKMHQHHYEPKKRKKTKKSGSLSKSDDKH